MDYDKKTNISRRDFITLLWGVIAALPFLYSFFKFINPPQKKFKSASQKLSINNTSAEIMLDSFPVKSSKIINIDGDPVIVIRKSDNDIIALSAVCTHLNCIVGFKNENNEIYCACHGGQYDLNGNVIGGPPELPLAKYNVSIQTNKIIIKR